MQSREAMACAAWAVAVALLMVPAAQAQAEAQAEAVAVAGPAEPRCLGACLPGAAVQGRGFVDSFFGLLASGWNALLGPIFGPISDDDGGGGGAAARGAGAGGAGGGAGGAHGGGRRAAVLDATRPQPIHRRGRAAGPRARRAAAAQGSRHPVHRAHQGPAEGDRRAEPAPAAEARPALRAARGARPRLHLPPLPPLPGHAPLYAVPGDDLPQAGGGADHRPVEPGTAAEGGKGVSGRPLKQGRRSQASRVDRRRDARARVDRAGGGAVRAEAAGGEREGEPARGGGGRLVHPARGQPRRLRVHAHHGPPLAQDALAPRGRAGARAPQRPLLLGRVRGRGPQPQLGLPLGREGRVRRPLPRDVRRPAALLGARDTRHRRLHHGPQGAPQALPLAALLFADVAHALGLHLQEGARLRGHDGDGAQGGGRRAEGGRPALPSGRRHQAALPNLRRLGRLGEGRGGHQVCLHRGTAGQGRLRFLAACDADRAHGQGDLRRHQGSSASHCVQDVRKWSINKNCFSVLVPI